jgi:hypothetical protein
MGTPVTSKPLLMIEVGYKFNFIYCFFAFRCVFYVYPHIITVHLCQFIAIYFAFLSHHITYVCCFQLSFLAYASFRHFLTHLQCICANIRSRPTQPLGTCEAPSLPSNTQLSSTLYMSSYPCLDSPSQIAALMALKQHTYWDPDSTHCLLAYMQLKRADRGFNRVEELVQNNDQRVTPVFLLEKERSETAKDMSTKCMSPTLFPS